MNNEKTTKLKEHCVVAADQLNSKATELGVDVKTPQCVQELEARIASARDDAKKLLARYMEMALPGTGAGNPLETGFFCDRIFDGRQARNDAAIDDQCCASIPAPALAARRVISTPALNTTGRNTGNEKEACQTANARCVQYGHATAQIA